jgi:hypothetical protein
MKIPRVTEFWVDLRFQYYNEKSEPGSYPLLGYGFFFFLEKKKKKPSAPFFWATKTSGPYPHTQGP